MRGDAKKFIVDFCGGFSDIRESTNGLSRIPIFFAPLPPCGTSEAQNSRRLARRVSEANKGLGERGRWIFSFHDASYMLYCFKLSSVEISIKNTQKKDSER
ncbi:hypothetical protein [Alcanivorax quisquiliarum]|uniref:Uncharacterized protein n=1 Tax=Alcanivorax quisquiliarum TaxID=2933565 RepID=A0ABT0E8L6_9GAMM|nr:hypothetical protein [Alcanivorax quisquiliarum]MCK0538180.1 hypothetical protein [Alcanivorax quisquiliarum]